MDYDILRRKPSETKYMKPDFVDGYNKALDDVKATQKKDVDKKIERQDLLVSKVLFEMLSYKLILEVDILRVRQYLNQLYSIGLNDGGTVYSHAKKIVQFDRKGVMIETYNSASHAARKLGICKTGISKAALGKQPTAGGYFWKYKND